MALGTGSVPDLGTGPWKRRLGLSQEMLAPAGDFGLLSRDSSRTCLSKPHCFHLSHRQVTKENVSWSPGAMVLPQREHRTPPVAAPASVRESCGSVCLLVPKEDLVGVTARGPPLPHPTGDGRKTLPASAVGEWSGWERAQMGLVSKSTSLQSCCLSRRVGRREGGHPRTREPHPCSCGHRDRFPETPDALWTPAH